MQKNTLVFFVGSMLIFVGWVWLQHTLWPPPPRKAPVPEAKIWPEKTKPAEKAETVAKLIALAAPLGNAGDPVRLALSWPLPASFAPKTLTRTTASWKSLPVPVQKALLLAPPFPPGPEALTQLARLAALREAPPQPKPEVQTVALGGPNYHLQATLTTRGAGVQQFFLNNFKAADWQGRPEESNLELIQDDPITPSYLLYHYPDPTADVPALTLGERIWKFDGKRDGDDAAQEAAFSTDVPGHEGLRIVKTYRLTPGVYHLELTLEIVDERDGKAGNTDVTRFRYQLAGARGLPIEGEWYTSIFRTAAMLAIDQRGTVWRDTQESATISHKAGGDRYPGSAGDSVLHYAGVMNQYFGSILVLDDKQPLAAEGGTTRNKILAYARPTLESTEKPGRIGKLRGDELVFETGKETERYTLLPRVQKHYKDLKLNEGDRAAVSFYVTSTGEKVATWIRRGQTLRPMFDDITVRVHSQELTLRPGQKIAHRFLVYNGPVKSKLLGEMTGDDAVLPAEWVDRYTDTLHLNKLTDWGRFSFWSDLIIQSTRLMHWLLNRLRFFGDGLSIILLTVVVRGLMFPISRKQAYFSVKMQELAPEMKKIQEKYKNDPRGKTEATMELYRKHNVHPLGGCLPILLQMPIFIGLYFALQESVFFRLAPFLWWMKNLAAPDMLLYWGESIPFLSDPDSQGTFLYLGPYLNLLPIIAVTLMIVQQKVMTPPPQDEQQEMQFKMMRYMMVVFGLMFYKVAAGLCIYFIASSAWGLAERRFLPKKKVLVPVQAGGTETRAASGKRRAQPKPPEKKNGQIQKVRDWWQEVLKQARKR